MPDDENRDDQRRRLSTVSASSTEKKEAVALRGFGEDRQALLFEHRHRVRSVLATIRSLATRMVETSSSVEDFGAHLVGRIDAIGRTQMSISNIEGSGFDLETLVRDEMLAQVAASESFEVEGPDVVLPEATAMLLTLALHELGTNAIKFGALAEEGGRVQITWSTMIVDDTSWLHLLWKETGVPIASVAPRRAGLGTELIQQRIAYELGGRGILAFRPGGICCTIEVPLGSVPGRTDANA